MKKTTIGTAGKIFNNEPGAWKPLPRIHISDWDRPVSSKAPATEKPRTPLNPLARLIDHTILKPEATEADILTACREAVTHHFFSVCLPPVYVVVARRELQGSEVKTCTVIGFPLGYQSSATKAREAAEAAAAGADELDMVINVGWIKTKQHAKAQEDIRATRAACAGKTLKVILENCLLTDEEKKEACKIAVAAGADFVKTSTGFAKSGATIDDVRLMRETVGPKIGVKAAGGIRDADFAAALVAAGANRLGTSASVALIQGRKEAPSEVPATRFLPY